MNLDQLERLARLRDQGVLSEAEFQAQKVKLMEAVAIASSLPQHRSNRLFFVMAGVILTVAVAIFFVFRSFDIDTDLTPTKAEKPGQSVVAASPPKKLATAPKLETTRAVVLEIDGENIPKVLRGQWGTSKENCAGNDDYGPMLISSKGFSHYEVTAEAGRIMRIKTDTISIEFSSTDPASNEAYGFMERWRYDGVSDRLIATTYEGETKTTVYRRC